MPSEPTLATVNDPALPSPIDAGVTVNAGVNDTSAIVISSLAPIIGPVIDVCLTANENVSVPSVNKSFVGVIINDPLLLVIVKLPDREAEVKSDVDIAVSPEACSIV